ncbi:hypothetical protein SUGI_0091860 [Cryptomeria japonica]|nr:hypothetical protein SUGI_0091860 [Cryptomeria japonica]
MARIKLGNFWDDIVGQEENHVLPSDFRTTNKWINAGTAYRRLVEPLDIAKYSDGVRPHRHIVLEKLMKEKEQTRTGGEIRGSSNYASLTEDSIFWAPLDEARKAFISLQQEQDKKAPLQESLSSKNTYGV